MDRELEEIHEKSFLKYIYITLISMGSPWGSWGWGWAVSIEFITGK
jgi:hypothetical protein